MASSVVLGQDVPQDLSIVNYEFVAEQRVTRTQSNVTYRADLVNRGPAVNSVVATVTSLVSSVQAIPEQSTLTFSPVPANGQVTSRNLFTILVDRSVPFSFANLQWKFLPAASMPPVANAGLNQTTKVGSTVTLNGSGSTNPSGIGTLAYSWAFTSRPAGSSAALVNPASVMPTFVPDLAGDYRVGLTVTNGAGSSTASVMVSTLSTPPVANAGPNQTLAVGSTAVLNGSASTSVDGRPLTYVWTLNTRPPGSAAALTGSGSVSPTLIVDKPGTYVAQLIVNDGLSSNPATITITTRNSPPVANAGSHQVVNVNGLVQLNGAGSTDVDGDPLTYQWTLITVPAGSTAALNSPTAVNPTFTADHPGAYVAQLIVNDGLVNSVAVTTMITTNPVLAPSASAGQNQTVTRNNTVALNGSGTDPQNLPLTFQWSLLSKPAGSAAALSGTTLASPTFVADLAGAYVAQVIVNNGFLSSPPSTVMISTTSTPPVASAGPNQNVPANTTVTLDGSGSVDPYHAVLTYLWSFTSRPAGSAATLLGANTVSPSFVADVAGTYVAQLIVNDGVTSSDPATVTISAQAVTLVPNTLNLTNAPGTLTVVLSAPAHTGGQVITLTSSDTAVATVPATLTVQAGASGANVVVTPGTTSGSSIITAAAAGFASGTATVTVAKPGIVLTLDSSRVGLSRTINGTISLGAPAPAGGISVALLANPGGVVDVQPASVSIAAGATTGTFTVLGVAEGAAVITASAPAYASGTVNVSAGILGAINLSVSTVGLGQSVAFPVTISSAAPAGGITVTLTSSDSSRANVTPASVFIAGGAKTPDTQPQVNGTNLGSATLTASSASFTSASQHVQVTATLSFPPAAVTIVGTTPQNLTLTLSGPAPVGGLTINLSSSNPSAATVPSTVTFTANATTTNVPVTGIAIGSTVIHASALPNLADTTVNVTVVSDIILPSNVTVQPGDQVEYSVALAKPAPASGVIIALAISDPSVATLLPVNVFIPEGQTQSTRPPRLTGIKTGSATITASAFGFMTTSETIHVGSPATLSFSPVVYNFSGAGPQNLTLRLSTPAPIGGLTVSLNSDNSTVAAVPASLTIQQGTQSVTVPTTTLAQGTATITAAAPGMASTTATVNVGTGTIAVVQSISLPATSVPLGQSAPFAVSVSSAPASDLTIALASDNAAVTLSTPTVVIPAGQTTPAVQPQVTGAAIGSAHVSASASGYTQGVGVVNVPAPSLKFAGNLTLIAGAQGNLTLTLTGGQAPSGGLTVTLNSDNTSAATVPATISFPAGASSVLVPVTAGLVQSTQTANLTASAAGIAPASAAVTVNPAGGISVSSATVGTNQSATLTITLPGPAASDVNVALSSSDSSKATVPASVTIAAGATSTTATVNGLSAGTVTITAAAPGFGTGTGSVTVTPLVLTAADLTVTSGAQGTLTLTLTGGQAPAGGLTVNLSSDNTNVATVAPTATFAAGATTATAQVTGGPVTAQQTANITATATGGLSATSKVTVTPLPTIMVAPVSLGLGQTANLQVTLAQAAPSDLTVTLASSDATKVTVSPATITILKGATSPATAPQVTGQGIGTANITASAPGYAAGTGAVTVTAPTMTLTPATLTVNPGSTGTLTLTLTGGQAPSPGGLTVNLASSSTAVATVPATVTIAAGATTATVTVTGVAGGTATITASAPNIADATATVNVPIQISVQNTSTGLGLSTNLQITLAQAAAADVTINLASSDASKVAVSPATVTILKGATSPATAPQVTGLIAGSTATITASATGFLAGTGTVTVTPPAAALTGPASISVSGTPVNFVLTLTGGKAPPVGLTFSLSSSDATKATVPATVTMPAGATTVNVPVTGVAAGGPVTITASAPGIANATATFTIPAVVTGPGISVPAGSVGQNLQTTVIASLSQSVGAGGASIKVTSSDPTRLLVSTHPLLAGSQQITVNVTEGQTSIGFYVQGLAKTGTATVTLSSVGYSSGTGIITLTPSGFLLTGPFGASSFTTYVGGSSTTLTLSSARLDAALNFAEAQQVRTGYVDPNNPASGPFTASVGMISSTPGVGTVISPVVFSGGDDTGTTQFTPTTSNNSGSTTLTAVALNGFSTPVSGNTVTGLVNGAGIQCAPLSVGQKLQTTTSCSLLGGSATGGQSVVVTSSDSSKLLLAAIPKNATTCTDAGAASITLTTIGLVKGAAIPSFCVYGVGNSGTVTYGVSVPGYSLGTGTVTLAPSGFVISGPNGVGAPNFFVLFTASTNINVYAAQLDSSLNYATTQALAGGISVNVDVTSSNPAAGVISPSPVAIASGSAGATTQFQTGTSGNTVLGLSTPAGFSTPAAQFRTVTATIPGSTFSVTDGLAVGQNLQTSGAVSVGVAPSSDLAVTLTSNDPNQLLLSSTATAAGSSSITVTIPAGHFSASYFVQSAGGILTQNLAVHSNAPSVGSISWDAFTIVYQGNPFAIAAGNTNSPFVVWTPGASTAVGVSSYNQSVFLLATNTNGTASAGITYTASASGFASRDATVNVIPSAVVFNSIPFLFLNANGAAVPVNIFTAALNPSNNSFAEIQALSGGAASLQVSLISSTPSAGMISSPVTILAGSSIGTAQFTPLAGGQTNITVVTPSGFTAPSNRHVIQAFVQ